MYFTCLGTIADDVVTFDLNLWYTTGDMAWILASTALVWLMIPGVGFFYSGLARRKSALSLIWLSLMSVAIVSFQVPHTASSDANCAVVFLGLFLGILQDCQPIHWQLGQLRHEGCVGTTKRQSPRSPFRYFPMYVRSHHPRARNRRRR